MSHWVRGHLRNGRWVRPHLRRNPRRGYRGSGSGNGNGSGIKIAIAAGVAVTVTASPFAINSLKPKPNTSKQPRISANTLSMEAQAGFKRAEVTLTANNFKSKLTKDSDADCAAHSYGQVRNYFQSNPCRNMVRAYMQIGEVEKHLILVAISWVAMPTTASAQNYKHLVDTRAGGITELSRETTLLKTITYEDATYISGIKGAFVWDVKVKPMFSATSDEVNTVVAAARQQ
jgi:hypothetical protein